jgi:HlyD family secretion protein
VAEADVGHLRAGMTATFTVDAYPGDKFTGAVRQVRDAPQIVQNVVTYDAVIDVGNEALKLKPGMTANVTFVWADQDNVLRVPNAALRFRAPADWLPPGAGAPGATRGRGRSEQRSVWVLRGDKPVNVALQTGVTDGTFTEVTAGELAEGDTVVTEVTGGKPAGAAGGPPGAGAGQNPFRRMF